MYTYRNVSDSDQTVLGVGIVAPGKTFTSDEEIINPNFELVREKKEHSKKED